MGEQTSIESISAVTLVCTDMQASLAFYADLGFDLRYGGADVAFSSLVAGAGHLNLQLDPTWSPPAELWGRIIFWVDDVDEVYARAERAGHTPSTAPRDAEWGERYFHISDPDGHELSFARSLDDCDAG